MAVIGSVSPNMAANAYSSLQNVGGAAKTTQVSEMLSGGQENAGGVSFSDFMRDNIKDSLHTLKSGEELSKQAVAGSANLTDVVQAVTSAELTLQTVVAVRDRMISAYQDIMRMPI